jgi:Icc-related predicted phosphoesterase
MTRLVWLTDLHLNFCSSDQIEQLLDQLRDQEPAALLVGGDIGESHSVIGYLEQLVTAGPWPIYFVLGNHDFYYGSISGVRAAVAELCRKHPQLHYLSQEGVIPLTPRAGLVGHDGWADGRIGNYMSSVVMMNDYKLIAELAGYTKSERWRRLQQLGDEAAEHIQSVLPAAVDRFQQVYLLTHVPPVREACWYEGQLSDDEWAPHFTCQAMGETIRQIMRKRPDRQLSVLCGHTHGEGCCHPLPNVKVLTGGAVYGSPAVTRIIDLED